MRKSREEILIKNCESITVWNENKLKAILVAMREYADQETVAIRAELESAKGNLGMIVESDTKDIIRLNEKIDMLKFEIVAADFEHQRQVKELEDKLSDLQSKHTFLCKEYNRILPEVSDGGCKHRFVQKDLYWSSCTNCGCMKALSS